MKLALFLLHLCLFSSILGQGTFDSLLHHSNLEVYFDSDKHTLHSSSLEKIDSFQTSHVGDQVMYEIHAHTDAVGSVEYNVTLSRNRALSIKEHLESRGVADHQIMTDHFGESLPQSSNDSESGRQLNRRATIKVFQTKELQWLRGKISDEESSAGISAYIKLHSKSFESETKSDSNGLFKIAAPPNEIVGLDIRAKGFLLETKMLKVKPLMSTRPVELAMPKIAIGKSFQLDRLFFEGNKDVLREKSFDIFEQLYLFMADNKDVCIGIGGHINLPFSKPVKKESWNMRLSIARAKQIHDLLVEKSIHKDRIYFKGYGNSKMLYPEATEEYQMAKNRRVEIKIMDCQIVKSLPDDVLLLDDDFSTGKRNLLQNNIN